MKFSFLLIAILFLIGCQNDRTTLNTLQSEINYLNIKNDSLEKEIKNIKPGLGDLMMGIQIHHNKLYFAGMAANWPLAQFEHDEIMETLKQAELIEKDRSEVQLFKAMIYPQLDSIQLAIKLKNGGRFTSSFSSLTSACNNCHTNTKYSFNRIVIPEHPPYSNQEF